MLFVLTQSVEARLQQPDTVLLLVVKSGDIGVHLELPALNMVTSTLNGQVVDRVRLACPERLQPDDAIARISDYIVKIETKFNRR